MYKSLASCKDYGFKDQITRSGLSIPSNIAEGAGRNSDKDFTRFLNISVGSSYELETQLIISYEIELIDESKLKSLTAEVESIIKMIAGLKKSLN